MEEEKKIVKKKKNKYIIIVFLLALIIGGSCGLYYVDTFYGEGKINTIISSLQEKTQKNTDTAENPTEQATEKNSVTLSAGGTLFATKGKRFLMCTKDGVKYMNGMGDQKWNDTFTMAAPELIEEGGYYAVGDLAGKTAKVYNESGPVYTVQVTGNILYFALNRNGYLGIITKDKEVYSIMVYNNTGTQLIVRQEGETGVYPFSMDISDDNRIFAISYLDTTDVEPVGSINFFYVNESEGRNFSESMFASVIKTNELIPKIFYLDNGNLIVASDRGLYAIGSDGKEKWNIELTNHINYIGVEKKKYIVIAYGSAISGKNSRKVGNVSWINGDGKEIADFQAKDSVTYLNCNQTGTIIGCSKTYYGLKIGGRAFWEYTATKDMTDVLLMENVNNVLFVSNDTAVILNMDRVSQDTAVKEEKQKAQNTEKVIQKQKDDEDNKQQEEQNDEQNEENEQKNQNEQNNAINEENNETQQQNDQNQQKSDEKEENQQGE
ncbi:DUF5711 family protein [Lachnospiraceae bacterium 46-61]